MEIPKYTGWRANPTFVVGKMVVNIREIIMKCNASFSFSGSSRINCCTYASINTWRLSSSTAVLFLFGKQEHSLVPDLEVVSF